MTEDNTSSRINERDDSFQRKSNEGQSEAPLHLDVEAAFNIVGGFGRFQILATLVMSIILNSGNYLYYSFAYMVQEQ